MNNFQNQHWNNQQQNNQSNQHQSTNQTQPNQSPPNNQTQPSWLMQIAGACLPVLLKQFTGQEMMPTGSPSNNAMEVSLVLSQVLTLQQQIITSQQDLASRIVNLETRASQQFIGLAKQVQNLSAVRLTHEKKSIDYSLPHENEINQS